MARLKVNMNPENDDVPFSSPKIDLDIGVDCLNLGVTKKQVRLLFKWLDSFNRMSLGVPYRKYKPFNIRK